MRPTNLSILYYLVLSLPFSLQAKEYSFLELWNLTLENSPEISIEKNEVSIQSSKYESSRSHFAPQLSIQATSLSTNDPGKALFSKLSQRSIEASDFSPSLLNSKDRTYLNQISLKMNFPLYANGADKLYKLSQLESKKSYEFKQKAKRKYLYSSLLRSYALLTERNKQKVTWANWGAKIGKLRAGYKLKSKSNLMGQAGHLSLSAIYNQLQLLIQENDSQITLLKQSISRITGLKEVSEIKISVIELDKFLSQHLGKDYKAQALGQSYKLKSLHHLEKAQINASDATEKNLGPKIGFFTSNEINKGELDTATNTSLGLYMKWDWSPRNLQLEKREQLSKLVLKSKTHLAEMEEKNNKESSITLLENLHNSKNLLKTNIKILNSQRSIFTKLYNNGAINAVQHSEVFNKNIQAISQLNQVNLQLITLRSMLASYSTSNFKGE